MGNVINPALYFDDDEDEDEEVVNLRLYRRGLRDSLDPFKIPQREFIRIYRLDQRSAIDLVEELEPFMPAAVGPFAIPHFLRVLVALNFLGSGSYQRRTGNDFTHCMSQTMVSRCLQYVCDALNFHLLNSYVQFPTTEREIRMVEDRFFINSGLRGVIAAVDGSQIAISKPSVEEHLYINRKGYHSLNAMIACTYDLIIVAINARFPGSTHDSFVWRNSFLRRKLNQMYANGRRNFWCVGDSGYPLEPWLVTPIVGAPAGTPQGRYTRAHILARNCVERCIGVLKNRFRCLLKHRTLHYTPEKAGLIVNACVILHNICIKRNIPVINDDDDSDEDEDDDDEDDNNNNAPGNNRNYNIHNLGIQTRNHIVNTQFT